ncbi:hypothetical protein EDC04DRAFT_2200344 [Pisolithus marmoratus]|nr:hypothetical protein EDC04DRAFT_2200344 [Pisolithus marmoratus]
MFKRIPDTMTFTFTFLITITSRMVPILFVEVKPYITYNDAFAREEADDHMRHGFYHFVEESTPVPKLYGISALGTRFCVYEYTAEDRRITLKCITPDHKFVTDTAPKERWNLDILQPEGEARLKEVVGYIKKMAAELGRN